MQELRTRNVLVNVLTTCESSVCHTRRSSGITAPFVEVLGLILKLLCWGILYDYSKYVLLAEASGVDIVACSQPIGSVLL